MSTLSQPISFLTAATAMALLLCHGQAQAYQVEFQVTDPNIKCVQFQGQSQFRGGPVRWSQINFTLGAWTTLLDSSGTPLEFVTGITVRATNLAMIIGTGACGGRAREVVPFNALKLDPNHPEPPAPFKGLAIRKKSSQ